MSGEKKQMIWLAPGDKFNYDYMVENVVWVKTLAKSQSEARYYIALETFEHRVIKGYTCVVSKDSTVTEIHFQK